jgi:hypothetical protein
MLDPFNELHKHSKIVGQISLGVKQRSEALTAIDDVVALHCKPLCFQLHITSYDSNAVMK